VDAGGGGTMEAAGSGGTKGRAAVARASGGGSKGWEVSAVGGTNSAVGQTETVNFESVARLQHLSRQWQDWQGVPACTQWHLHILQVD